MKKTILLLLLAFFTQKIQSQSMRNRIASDDSLMKGQSRTISNEPIDTKLNKKSNKLKLDNILSTDKYGSKERTYYKYDEHGWLLSELDSTWNNIKKTWVLDLSEYSRDANGNLIKNKNSEWDCLMIMSQNLKILFLF